MFVSDPFPALGGDAFEDVQGVAQAGGVQGRLRYRLGGLVLQYVLRSRICHLDEVTAVLTDSDADPDQVKRMRSNGVEVILA